MIIKLFFKPSSVVVAAFDDVIQCRAWRADRKTGLVTFTVADTTKIQAWELKKPIEYKEK